MARFMTPLKISFLCLAALMVMPCALAQESNVIPYFYEDGPYILNDNDSVEPQPVPEPKQKAVFRVERVYNLFERNELAFAYYRLCETEMKMPSFGFMDNVNVVSALLQKAMREAYPEKSLKEIEDGVLHASETIQKRGDDYYRKQGCTGPWAKAGKQHFFFIEKMEEDAIVRFLQD